MGILGIAFLVLVIYVIRYINHQLKKDKLQNQQCINNKENKDNQD